MEPEATLQQDISEVTNTLHTHTHTQFSEQIRKPSIYSALLSYRNLKCVLVQSLEFDIIFPAALWSWG